MTSNTDPLARPLVFGDKEQAEAVRRLERKELWRTLDYCKACKGDGLCADCCDHCDHACEGCDGSGKTPEALDKWAREYPGWCDPEHRR